MKDEYEMEKYPIDTYIALDVEATVISPNKSRIIEIGAIKIKNGKQIDVFNQLINPAIPISEEIEKLTGITKDMLKDSKSAKEVLKEFIEFCEDYPWLGHSINSDFGYIKAELVKNDMLPKGYEKYGYDTLALSRKLLPDLESKSLKAMCEYFGIQNEMEHRALGDAIATVKVFNNLLKTFYEEKKQSFKQTQLVYKVKKLQKITNWQKNYLNDLIKCHKINFSGNISELTISEASRIIDRYIFTYGKRR